MEARRAVLSGVVIAAGLAGAALSRSGGGKLAAQSAECSVGTDVACQEIRTCHRREWRWFWFGGLGLVPLKVCVESSIEVNYFRELGGGSGTPSGGDPDADIPDQGGDY